MDDLGAQRLSDLSSMMTARNRRWVEVYRDLCEWATLHDLVTSHQFAADTLIVRDGLLRTPIFARDTLVRLGELMKQAIDRQAKDNRRRIWLAGLAKKTKVLDHYRLAMSLAGIFDRGTPCFVPVPHELQERVYRSDADYVREPDDDESGAESGGRSAAQNIGAMYFVRFGPHAGDPDLEPRTCSRGNGRTRRPSSATCRPTRRPDSLCRSTRSASSRPTPTPGSPTWTSTSSRTAWSAPSASTSATARGTSLTRCCSPRRTSRRGATGYAALRPRRRRRRLPRLLRQRHGVPRRPGAPLPRRAPGDPHARPVRPGPAGARERGGAWPDHVRVRRGPPGLSHRGGLRDPRDARRPAHPRRAARPVPEVPGRHPGAWRGAAGGRQADLRP